MVTRGEATYPTITTQATLQRPSTKLVEELVCMSEVQTSVLKQAVHYQDPLQ